MFELIEELLDQAIRPSLASHGGNVEITDIDSNILYLKLTGGCQGCSSSKLTLKNGIEKVVLERFPFIAEVIDVTDHESGDDPYFK